jgi:branched-chain amino acid transport system substrate-binding protein
MRARALAVLFACVTPVLAAGCGGSRAEPFRIGMLSDCYGFFSGLHEPNVASAELPLIERGARLLGRKPSDGVGSAQVAGRQVELRIGCVAGTDEVIPEARRLVEEDGAQAVVGTLDPQQGMALREYARRRPETAFLIQPSAAPELTLSHRAPNVFRFALDAAQSVAGVGGYAYRRLGWRTAAVVADDLPFGWEEAAGFVAEFCALGGRVVDRVWIPVGTDPAAAATRVARSADGVYLAPGVSPLLGLLKRYSALRHDLSRQLVSSATLLYDPRLIATAKGVVVGGTPALQPTPAERAYVGAFARAFPSTPAERALSSVSLPYDLGVEAVLEALLHAQGASGAPLMAALAQVQLDSPAGRIRLDRNHQAVGPNYLSRVGKAGIETLKVVPEVEQTFGGYFKPSDPPPSRTSPACVKRTPPPWARR